MRQGLVRRGEGASGTLGSDAVCTLGGKGVGTLAGGKGASLCDVGLVR